MATKRMDKGLAEIGETKTETDLLDLISERFNQAIRNRPTKRRPANTGYMKEITAQKWLLKVYRGKGLEGKKRYKSETFIGHQDEAARRLTELQLRYGSNSPVRPSEMTFGMVLVLWEHAHETIWTPATVANHRSVAKRLEPLWDVKPDESTPKEFADFYQGLVSGGLKPSTVTRIHSVARSALNWARQQGYVLSNPAGLVRPPGAGSSEIKMPTTLQLRQLIRKERATDPLFAGLIEFAAVTGARRGEIAGLRWSDVERRSDGDYTVIFQRRVSLSEVLPGLKAGDFKKIVVGAALIENLRMNSVNEEWVFGTKRSHVSVGTISRKYKKLRDRMEIDVGTFHGLRHFCGSNLFTETTMTPIEISAHLGHSKPSTTLDLYAHVVDPDQTGASQALARAIAA